MRLSSERRSGARRRSRTGRRSSPPAGKLQTRQRRLETRQDAALGGDFQVRPRLAQQLLHRVLQLLRDPQHVVHALIQHRDLGGQGVQLARLEQVEDALHARDKVIGAECAQTGQLVPEDGVHRVSDGRIRNGIPQKQIGLCRVGRRRNDRQRVESGSGQRDPVAATARHDRPTQPRRPNRGVDVGDQIVQGNVRRVRCHRDVDWRPLASVNDKWAAPLSCPLAGPSAVAVNTVAS